LRGDYGRFITDNNTIIHRSIPRYSVKAYFEQLDQFAGFFTVFPGRKMRDFTDNYSHSDSTNGVQSNAR